MIDYDIDRLSLDELIGQLIVFGFDGLDINDHVIELIRSKKVGNVILFAKNISTPEQLFKLNQNLQKLAVEASGIPLLISIDQEGGMVTRIKNGTTYFPGAMTITASSKPNNSYLSGKYMGHILKALGVNMNLAPSLDINNNPKNPVIGVRSFGDEPYTVAKYGCEFIRGLQESIIATAKHFPGHGDTDTDSHLDLPRINKTLEELKEFELIPFKKAIEMGVLAIMSSHISFPALGFDKLPATLSKYFLTDFLRNELGFKGLIVTDCLEMKAIQTYYTTKKGVSMAIEAGANLAMVSSTKALQIDSIKYLKEKVLNGKIPIELIKERVKKVLEIKAKYVEYNPNKTYQDIKEIVEDKKTKEFSLSVVRDALTRVRGKDPKKGLKTLLVASSPVSTTIADESLGDFNIISSVKKELPYIDTLEVTIRLKEEELDHILELSKKYEQIILCSYNANIYKNQLELIEKLNKTCNLYVIAMRNPYDSLFVKDIKNLILMYEYTPNSVKIFIEYLKGNITPLGKLPVTL